MMYLMLCAGFDMEDDNEIEFTSFLAATMDVNLGEPGGIA